MAVKMEHLGKDLLVTPFFVADGTMTGEYDPEGDRMFNGDTLNCRGWLIYRKAGRAGLVFIEGDGTGGADDSWRDLDRDDEWAYQQSLGSNPAN